MNRETTEEQLLAIREKMHDLREAINQVSLRVDVLWEERKRRRVVGPQPEDRQ